MHCHRSAELISPSPFESHLLSSQRIHKSQGWRQEPEAVPHGFIKLSSELFFQTPSLITEQSVLQAPLGQIQCRSCSMIRLKSTLFTVHGEPQQKTQHTSPQTQACISNDYLCIFWGLHRARCSPGEAGSSAREHPAGADPAQHRAHPSIQSQPAH